MRVEKPNAVCLRDDWPWVLLHTDEYQTNQRPFELTIDRSYWAAMGTIFCLVNLRARSRYTRQVQRTKVRI